MSAEVVIEVAGTENAVTVPTQAVHRTDDARDVADLALGIDGESFGQLLAANTPQEAAAQGKELETHVTHLLVHATLHLLGYEGS